MINTSASICNGTNIRIKRCSTDRGTGSAVCKPAVAVAVTRTDHQSPPAHGCRLSLSGQLTARHGDFIANRQWQQFDRQPQSVGAGWCLDVPSQQNVPRQ